MSITYELKPHRRRLLKRVAAPAGEPVTLAEAKLFLRIGRDEENTLISDMIVSARMVAENWLRRSLMSQSWLLAYDDGIADDVWLPMGPVVQITQIALIAANGNSQSVDDAAYALDAAQDMLKLTSALMAARVEITYTTGYGNASAVPMPIRQGMLSHIASMYDNRGDGCAFLPAQAASLYAPFRETRL